MSTFFKGCTMKYQQYIKGVNDSVIVTFPQAGRSTMCVPMNENNMDYAQIKAAADAGEITIEEAD